MAMDLAFLMSWKTEKQRTFKKINQASLVDMELLFWLFLIVAAIDFCFYFFVQNYQKHSKNGALLTSGCDIKIKNKTVNIKKGDI